MARDFRSPEQSVRRDGPSLSNSGPSLSHSSYTPSFGTSDSMAGFSIRLLRPQPTQGVVLVPRIENHVYLDIGLPLQSLQSPMTWNAVQVPSTASVKRVDELRGGEEINPLTLDITVRGATTRQECSCICGQCEERVGRRVGQSSLIDFHSPSNIIRTKNGTARVHFTFCCYSRHHQKEDEQFVCVIMTLMMSRLPPDLFPVSKLSSRTQAIPLGRWWWLGKTSLTPLMWCQSLGSGSQPEARFHLPFHPQFVGE